MRNTVAIIIALALIGYLAYSFKGSVVPPDANAAPKLAFVTNGVADFWVLAGKGVQDSASEIGVDASFHMPPDGLADQKRIIEDLMVKGVDGIAVSPIDPVNQTPFLDRIAEQTLLITHDSDAPDSKRICFVGVDNYEAGRMCGELVEEALPNGGKVAIFVGRLEQDNARLRRQGVIDQILGREWDSSRYDKPGEKIAGNGFEVVATLTDQFDMAKGKANVEDILSRHDDIAGCIGLFAYNTPLILEALEQSGRSGKVKVISFDEDERTLQGIIDGTVHGTIVQNPYEYGAASMRLLKALTSGDRSGIPENGIFKVPTRTIRKAEVESFREDMRKKLGK
ncbi:MAG: sugar-binding protein [Planctomycetes bacterium]|jgi:ribose transport system substrate-binding protein|nr:sugar-binding protein [Planctomycetota bacterium]MBT6785177.1 sugar-binding protein [Planctomycetota bacterium]